MRRIQQLFNIFGFYTIIKSLSASYARIQDSYQHSFVIENRRTAGTADGFTLILEGITVRLHAHHGLTDNRLQGMRAFHQSVKDTLRVTDHDQFVGQRFNDAIINLGFDINEQSLSNIDTILMVMDDDTITADFRLKSEDLADSFSILIKASYVGNLRREGIKVNVAELKEMFTQQLNTVSVNGMLLSQEQKDSIIQVITSLLESL